MPDWDTAAVQQAGNIVQVGMQNQSNKRAFKRSAEFTREMFDATNEYNHPVQQMARLKEAGLNPALMYGKSGGTGQATQPAGQKQEATQIPDLNAGLSYAQLQLMKSQQENADSQTNLNTLQGATEAEKTALVKKQTAKTGAEAISAGETAKLASELTNAQLSAQLVEIEGKKAQTRVTESTARVAEATEGTKVATANKQLEALKADINLKKYQADKAYAETVNRKLNNMYDAFKIQSAKEGTPIDQGAFGFLPGIANLLSSWTQQGKPPGLDPELWRDYNIYLRKNKQQR